MRDREEREPIAVLVSEPYQHTLAAVRVFAGAEGGALLAGGPSGLSDAERRDLITKVRAGQHVELEMPIIAFRQKDGVRNKNGLRLKTARLGAIAKSYKGKPMLVDHRSWSQGARIGTIASGELVDDQGDGWSSIRMTVRVVKPDAVISVLDGTLDRFSIAWSATGPVMCTAHAAPVGTKCDCWPLDEVLVDGETKIAEYEFTSAEGSEVSGVNSPAVGGTKIEEVRAALAAAVHPNRSHKVMAFTRLAAVLGLAALGEGDEDRAIAAVQELDRRRAAAETERETYRARASSAEGELATSRTALAEAQAARLAIDVDAVIADAYRGGKLVAKLDADGKRIPSSLEASLRNLGAKMGIEALRGQCSDLPVVVPLGQRAADEVPETERTAPAALPAPVLKSVARQLGLNAETLAANAAAIGGTRRNRADLIVVGEEG